ncbi:multicopper oxidase domain-containing protein [Mucilaginibacter pedocola]|uniref:Copper oxidase n=1 Tax=Mucilaginibacter pedocola TaxID=1792845 RepID=A0A1S9PN32_9SPHI|nr:multicopper oxidase domain-containing protein [Mucilaginibacter pedocola]OOQ61988.1 copper oxidase [Mucilaginibacter pedocola]
MRKIIYAMLLLVSQLAVAQAQMNDMQDMQKTQPITYTCPMHPEIHSGKPGNCPKCGMKLVKEKTKAMSKKPVKKASEKAGMPMDTAKKTAKQMPGMDMNSSMDKAKEMPGMQMDKMGAEMMKEAKADLGPIKTLPPDGPPRTVKYNLFVADTTVTFGKKKKHAIAVNGQIPMPTLTFTEGDTAEIVVHNNLDEPTSLHWHGLFLPNKEDGVAYLTQMPIPAHSTYTYRFPIVQHGTHWYHSHYGLQEQIGMYGSFILKKRREWDIPTIPLVISEWTDVKPKEVDRRLHAASDWFAVQKGSTQSYSEAIKHGAFGTKLANEWKRMNAMDLSDVYYDNFLLNGKNQLEAARFKAGDKVRLRISNSGASDYFWLSYAGGKITVVANDGNDVVPVEVDRLIIAVSETYDVVVTIPDNKSYEFLVTPEDRSKYASLWLGSGTRVSAKKMDRPKYFAGMKMMNDMMDMNGNMKEMEGMKMQNQVMDMNTVMYPEITGPEKKPMPKADNGSKNTGMGDMKMGGMDMSGNHDLVTLNYGMLRAPQKTNLPKGPWRELKFDLTGNMNRYVWTLDNKTISETDKILIKKGENLRLILYNNSMMRHPMHLHGHDFRVLNGQGDYAPLKNVLDILPMERDTLEFAASEPGGDWFFHCHILYHMMSGMGRIFSYENSPPNPALPDPKLAQRKLFGDDRMFHLMGQASLESNGSDGQFMYANTRWQISTLWHLGFDAQMGYESETMVGRYIGRMQWLLPYVGFDYHYKRPGKHEKNIFGDDSRNMFGQTSNKEQRRTVVAGLAYTLPMLFVADMRVDGNGKLRFQLGREDIPVTSRLRFSLMVNTDKEYMTGFRYLCTKYLALSTHYDSDMGLGAGLAFNY